MKKNCKLGVLRCIICNSLMCLQSYQMKFVKTARARFAFFKDCFYICIS